MYTLRMQSNRIDSWRKGYLNFFQKLQYNSGFSKDISQIKNNPSRENELLPRLFSTHSIPPNLYNFIKHYIETGEEDPGYITSFVQIISDFDEVAYPFSDPRVGYKAYKQMQALEKREIKIVIDPDANLDETIAILHDHRKQIEEMRRNAAKISQLTKRRRSAPKTARNTAIKQHYDQGMKPRQIAQYLTNTDNNPDGLTGPDISKIIHKMK